MRRNIEAGKERPQYKPQTDAILSQANPVSGTQYEITALANQRDVKIIGIAAYTIGGTTDPLEVHIVADALTYLFDRAAPVAGTPYFIAVSLHKAINDQDMLASLTDGGVILVPQILEFKRLTSVKIEATWSVQPTNLDARVRWAKKVS